MQIAADDQGVAWMWQSLTRRIEGMLDAFPGVAGIYLKDLRGGHELAVRADEVFPTASSIKIHILTQLLRRAAAGELDLDEKVPFPAGQLVPGSGVLTYLEGEVVLSRLNIAILMIIVSDNSATNLCIDWAGMVETNALIKELGMAETLLRRKMQDHAAIREGEENISTPMEMAAMLEHLYAGRPSPDIAERCLSILKKPKKGLINRACPADSVVANKPGGMERVRCDAGIVYLPNRPYILCVMSKFCLVEPAVQEDLLIDICRTAHETMVVLDSSNSYGLGISTQA